MALYSDTWKTFTLDGVLEPEAIYLLENPVNQTVVIQIEQLSSRLFPSWC